MFAPYLEKCKRTFSPWFIKRSSVHLTATLSNLNPLHFRNRNKMYKIGHAFTYLLLKEIVANKSLISVWCELD